MGKIAAVAVVLACSLGASGCARFGYTEVSRVRDEPDSGAKAGTSSDDAGGAGRPGGAGGASGSDSGAGGAGRGGGGGGMDGGQPPLDAASDADNGDAAPDDASVDPDDSGTTDPGSSGFCPQRPDVIFCDGFEPLNFDNWSYPVVTNGTLTRSTSQRHSGEASLRATISTSISLAARSAAIRSFVFAASSFAL